MKLETGFEERKPRVEMIPLLDVVFLLLVFFIYAVSTMAVHRGIKVNLPHGVAEKQAGERIVITISSDNRIQLEGVDLSMDDVITRVVQKHRQTTTPVLISGDRTAHLGTGLELLNKLQVAGIDHVAFQMDAPQ